MLYGKLPSPTSTRLINLLPGAPNDPLKCELLVIDLESDHVQYPAISYVWGDPSDKKPIQCMNEIIMIPASLHSFLKVHRNSEKPWICWADAICINQSGDREALRERAHQVGMMGTIFSKAKVVLVYLGEEPTGLEEFLSASSVLLKLLVDKSDPQLRNLDFLKVPAFEVISSLVLDTFDEITSHPWYQRVWTLQEFVLAQDLQMCIGRRTISYVSWRVTCQIFDFFYPHLGYRRLKERFRRTDCDLQNRCRLARKRLDRCRDIYKQDTTMPLSVFIEATLQLNTTDVRDRLYGGYGVLDRSVMPNIPVDYGISSNTLSQQLSALLVAEGKLTFVLQYCTGLKDPVPTWCISLDGSRVYWDVLNNSTIAFSCILGVYGAAGNSTQSSFIMVAEPGIMAVSGCILETIKYLTPPIPPISNKFDIARNWREFLAVADWIENTLLWLGEVHGLPVKKRSWNKLPTETSWIDITNELWRTLIQDVVYPSVRTGTRPEDGPNSARRGSVATRPEPEVLHCFIALLHFFHILQQNHRSGRSMNILALTDHATFEARLMYVQNMYFSVGKRVGATFSKRLALLPNEANIGDEICIFEGVNAPFLLRKSGEHYKIVGSCYLHGMMDGEALRRDDWKPTKILIE